MAKQNILSKDFFVDAPEQETRATILSIPSFVPNLTYAGEHNVSEAVQFHFEHGADTHQVSVSLLPLTTNQTRIALHVSNAGKLAAQEFKYISSALDNLESAIQAAINGKPEYYQPQEPKQGSARRMFNFMMLLVASAGMVFLWKKLS